MLNVKQIWESLVYFVSPIQNIYLSFCGNVMLDNMPFKRKRKPLNNKIRIITWDEQIKIK